jgi:hypothetical protein
MNTDILETSELYQMLVAKVQRETAECVQHETAERTLREAALDVLRGRFGELPEDVTAAVGAQTVDGLHALLVHAGTETFEQLRARLGL